MRTEYVQSQSGQIYNPRTQSADEFAEGINGIVLPRGEGRRKLAEQERSELLALIKPGDTIYRIIRSVSASGITRTCSYLIFPWEKNVGPRYLDYAILAMDIGGSAARSNDNVLVRVGTDIVSNLARALWPVKNADGSQNTLIERDI